MENFCDGERGLHFEEGGCCFIAGRKFLGLEIYESRKSTQLSLSSTITIFVIARNFPLSAGIKTDRLRLISRKLHARISSAGNTRDCAGKYSAHVTARTLLKHHDLRVRLDFKLALLIRLCFPGKVDSLRHQRKCSESETPKVVV